MKMVLPKHLLVLAFQLVKMTVVVARKLVEVLQYLRYWQIARAQLVLTAQ